MVTYSHATLSLARFADPVTLPELDVPDGDGSSSLWLLGSDDMASGQRIGSRTAHAWALLGLHATEQDAEAAYRAVGDVAALDSATERWTALMQSYSHRGETNWSPEPLFAPGNRRAHDGPFVVMTTVGFVRELDPDLQRTRAFIHGTAAVRSSFAATPGLRVQHVFWFGMTWTDPFTISVWDRDADLRPPVYETGEHRTRMDDYRRDRTADRSSFTRLRVLASSGTWGSGRTLIDEDVARPSPASESLT